MLEIVWWKHFRSPFCSDIAWAPFASWSFRSKAWVVAISLSIAYQNSPLFIQTGSSNWLMFFMYEKRCVMLGCVLDRYQIVEGEHALWDGVSQPYRETIRAFLVYFHNEVSSSVVFSFHSIFLICLKILLWKFQMNSFLTGEQKRIWFFASPPFCFLFCQDLFSWYRGQSDDQAVVPCPWHIIAVVSFVQILRRSAEMFCFTNGRWFF